MKENLAEEYYQKLENSLTPALELAGFFCDMYNLPVTKDDIELFNGLSIVFGRFSVWKALIILRTSYSNVRKSQDAINLIKGICKNDLKSRVLKEKEVDYPDYTNEIREILDKEEKIKNEQLNRDSSTIDSSK